MSTGTLTVRLVRSFSFKTFRTLILHDLDFSSITLQDLAIMIADRIKFTSALAFLEKHTFDTFKIYTQPHAAKTSNTIMNTEDDFRLILREWNKPLSDFGIQNETEISYFNYNDYLAFKINPETRWE